jgi:hypothetical protein
VLNVAGDLTACTVIEQRTSATTPKEQELEQAERYEQIRQEAGEDVVLSETAEA